MVKHCAFLKSNWFTMGQRISAELVDNEVVVISFDHCDPEVSERLKVEAFRWVERARPPKGKKILERWGETSVTLSLQKL